MNEENDSAAIPEWVVTFGDMMSLLLTFFIMLVSMSEIKEEDLYQAVADSIHRKFGYSKSVDRVTPGNRPPKNSNFRTDSTAGRAERLDTHKGGQPLEAPVGDYARVTTIRESSESVVGCVVFFEEDSSTLSDDAKLTLANWARRVIGKPQKIELRGHTSKLPLPLHSPFADHWQLATARAREVMLFLTSEKVDSRRLRVTAAADHEPLYTSTNRSELVRNNRVEVYLLDETVEDFAELP